MPIVFTENRSNVKNFSSQTCSVLNLANLAILSQKLGSKGWRGGESTRLPPIWPGFRKSWRRLHTCVEFVVGSLLCSERFFSWYSGFTLCSKTNVHLQIPLRPGIRDTKNQFVDVLPLNPFLFYLFEMVNIFSF